nr:Tn3 family transposase [Roseovarius sp. A-2]
MGKPGCSRELRARFIDLDPAFASPYRPSACETPNFRGLTHDRTRSHARTDQESSCIKRGIHTWNTKHLGQAVAARQRASLNCAPDLLAHISPLGWAHILFTGEYKWRRQTRASL